MYCAQYFIIPMIINKLCTLGKTWGKHYIIFGVLGVFIVRLGSGEDMLE